MDGFRERVALINDMGLPADTEFVAFTTLAIHHSMRCRAKAREARLLDTLFVDQMEMVTGARWDTGMMRPDWSRRPGRNGEAADV